MPPPPTAAVVAVVAGSEQTFEDLVRACLPCSACGVGSASGSKLSERSPPQDLDSSWQGSVSPVQGGGDESDDEDEQCASIALPHYALPVGALPHQAVVLEQSAAALQVFAGRHHRVPGAEAVPRVDGRAWDRRRMVSAAATPCLRLSLVRLPRPHRASASHYSAEKLHFPPLKRCLRGGCRMRMPELNGLNETGEADKEEEFDAESPLVVPPPAASAGAIEEDGAMAVQVSQHSCSCSCSCLQLQCECATGRRLTWRSGPHIKHIPTRWP